MAKKDLCHLLFGREPAWVGWAVGPNSVLPVVMLVPTPLKNNNQGENDNVDLINMTLCAYFLKFEWVYF